ncbi:hypothetical protein CAL7716_029610 [Calothrix sp. PCC 7716]|nr:hypothetical protein CAL7716_029610 [Calothrix sp. PCC 7716]
MFKYLLAKNFGIFKRLECQEHQKINIIIGENDTGKSYILKLLYTIAKSVEEYTKLSDEKSWEQILSDKMLFIFQPSKLNLGRIVRRSGNTLHVKALLQGDKYSFSFGKGAKYSITECGEAAKKLDLNALYIPSKEFLTALDNIETFYKQLRAFGFDQTYQDLIEVLAVRASIKKLDKPLEDVLNSLQNLFQGELSVEEKRFIFKCCGEKYELSQVAEGIKRISLLTTLIRNGAIKKGTILFIDEPETSLHPRTIIALCEILFALSQAGVQIYMATHSYFVLKKFELIARKHQESIQLCCLEKAEDINAKFYDIREGMRDNLIIDTSIKLYEEDVRLDIEA